MLVRGQYCEIVPEHFTWGSGGCGSVPGTGVWRTGGSEPDEEEEDARKRKRGSDPEAGRARIDRAAGAKRRRRPQGDMLTD